MSRRALIIACLVLVALAVAAWLAGRAPPAASPARPLLTNPVDEGTLASLTVSAPDGSKIVLKRGSLPGLWTISGQSVPAEWPANPARVRAVLRVLVQAAGSATTRLPGSGATVVTITTLNGETITLSLSEPLGGQAAAAVTAPPAAPYTILVGEDLHRLFRPEALAEWRSPAAFAQSPSAASRVGLGGATPLRLTRIRGAWSLSHPVTLPADGDAVARLLASLERLTISKAARRPDQPPQGPPTITIETDMRRVEGDATTSSVIVQELRLTGPTDGPEVQATVTAHLVPLRGQPELLWGPIDVMLDAGPLREITLAPASYLSRVAARTPPADVGAIELVSGASRRALKRELEAWVTDGGARLNQDDGARIASVLTWLCTTAADSVELLPDEPAPSGVLVTLKSLDGGVLRTLRVEAIADPSGKSLVRVHDGAACWHFQSPAAATLLEWLTGRL